MKGNNKNKENMISLWTVIKGWMANITRLTSICIWTFSKKKSKPLYSGHFSIADTFPRPDGVRYREVSLYCRARLAQRCRSEQHSIEVTSPSLSPHRWDVLVLQLPEEIFDEWGKFGEWIEFREANLTTPVWLGELHEEDLIRRFWWSKFDEWGKFYEDNSLAISGNSP